MLPSVKEVLQSLVDDDVVSSDKCGTQTVYWCLPSQAVQKVSPFTNSEIECIYYFLKKRSRIASLTEKLQSKSDQKQQLLEKREELRNCHQDTVCSKVLLYLFY